VTPDTEVTQAAKLLLENHFNGLPVVDSNGWLKGIICQSDLVSRQKKLKLPSFFTVLDGLIPLSSLGDWEREMKKITATTVEGVMTSEPVGVTPDTTLEDVATLMVEKKLHTLPVVEGGRLVGVIGKEDVLRTLAQD
jgi:CBS domain-containing protein